MELKNYIKTTLTKKEANLNEAINNLTNNLIKELSSYYSPYFTYNKYRKEIDKLTNKFTNTLGIKCYITSYNKHGMKSNTLYKIINRGKYTIKYDDITFKNAILWEITVLLATYGNDLFEGQIKLMIMNVLLKNFQHYSYNTLDRTYTLNFDIKNIVELYNELMEMDFEDIDYIKLPGIYDDIREKSYIDAATEYDIKEKPENIEDLTDLFNEYMTRSDKVKAIANRYLCTTKTARNYMKKFGLWNNTKKANEPIITVDFSKLNAIIKADNKINNFKNELNFYKL